MTDDLADTLREIVTRLDVQGIPYMLVGSVAALAHGHARSTQDFDLVIEVDAARLNAFVRSLPQERFYASEEAATEALRYATQFNVIDLAMGWKVERQLEDVRALVGLAGEALDRAYVERWVGQLGLRETWRRALQA